MILGKKLCESLYNPDTDLSILTEKGINEDHFDGYSKKIFTTIINHRNTYGKLPSSETIETECQLPESIFFSPGTEEPLIYYIDKVVERYEVSFLGKCLISSKNAIEKVKRREGSVDDILHIMEKTISDIKMSKARSHGKVINLKEEHLMRMQRYLELTKFQTGVKHFHTPWMLMDQSTGGVSPGHLWIIVARTGVGKTWASLIFYESFRRQASLDPENKGLKPPLYISMEMPNDEIIERADAIRYKLPYKDFKEGHMACDYVDKYFQGLEKKKGCDYYVVGDGIIETTFDVENLISSYDPGVVVIDGIWLFENEENKRNQAVRQISQNLRKMALVKNIPIVATAQFRDIRDNKTGKDQKRHGLQDIAESSAIARDSYCVAGFYQDKDQEANLRMQCNLLKLRGGKKSHFLCNWDLERMDFDDIEECDEDGKSIYGGEYSSGWSNNKETSNNTSSYSSNVGYTNYTGDDYDYGE